MTETITRRSPQAKRDLWTWFIEGAVHVVETLCPPLERTLSWNFSDRNMLAFEEDCDQAVGEGPITPRVYHVRDLHEEMGDFLPHAAGAA